MVGQRNDTKLEELLSCPHLIILRKVRLYIYWCDDGNCRNVVHRYHGLTGWAAVVIISTDGQPELSRIIIARDYTEQI